MVLYAILERDDLDDLPDKDCSDESEWHLLIECLEGAVLCDNDFEVTEGMDADPDQSRSLKQVLGIPDNYFIEIPCDVPDEQINLYIDALKGLTPRGRGS